MEDDSRQHFAGTTSELGDLARRRRRLVRRVNAGMPLCIGAQIPAAGVVRGVGEGIEAEPLAPRIPPGPSVTISDPSRYCAHRGEISGKKTAWSSSINFVYVT